MATGDVTVTQADIALAQAIMDVPFDNSHARYEHAVAEVLAKHRLAAIPRGWRLVPIEPTPEMTTGGMTAKPDHPAKDNTLARHERIVTTIWSAMLAAAPEPA